jgi:hypothetical protein
MNDKLLEVSMMLGDAIKKLDNLSAYKPDPYAHLKEAQERGEVIQVLEDSPKEMWLDLVEPEYYHEPEFYRIKPKEKKKLYLWAYQDKVTKSWKLTDRFMESAEDVEQDYRWIDNFYRIDNSMIEVEDEPI